MSKETLNPKTTKRRIAKLENAIEILRDDTPKEAKDVFNTEQLAERWSMEVGTLAVWRMRDKKRIKKGLNPVGPPWTEIGRGEKPRIRYLRDDIERYESANRRALPAVDASLQSVVVHGRRGTRRKGVIVAKTE